MEMRRGLLGRLVDLPIGGQQLLQPLLEQQPGRGGQEPLPPPPPPQQATQLPPPPPPPPPASAGGQFQWQPSGDIHLGVQGGGSVPLEKPATNPDVEVMSTDSSSSSSSDSQ